MTDQKQTTAGDEPTASPLAPGERAPRAMERVDVGPLMTLPLFRLAAAALAASLVVGAVGWAAVQMTAPQPKGPWGRSVGWGVVAVVLAHWVGLIVMRPWKVRRLGKWPFVWLMGRGVSFGGVLILAALLYFATQPRALAFGLAIAAGYFAALLAEVAVYAAHVRSVSAKPMPQ